ncbi:hypothetical protein KKC44_03460 [Patescibacteria group bacterium]|nr:hypothetical protein [Patescibacteria group bacterium]
MCRDIWEKIRAEEGEYPNARPIVNEWPRGVQVVFEEAGAHPVGSFWCNGFRRKTRESCAATLGTP